MASFTKGPNYRDPFGNHNFLRSTRGVKTKSASFAHETLPTELIDGVAQKVLRKGETLALITSGPFAGKVGVFQAGGTSEVQTLTKAGTVSGGSFKLTVLGEQTGALAWDITAAQLATALNALDSVAEFGSVTVTGGPIASTPFTVTFFDEDGIGQNVAQMTADATLLTGAGAGVTPATGTPGVDGATDGRQTLTNIVGVNNTYLPWQLLDRDVEVAVVYECAAVQAKCYERDAAGARVALTNTTAAAMFGKKNLDIRFPE